MSLIVIFFGLLLSIESAYAGCSNIALHRFNILSGADAYFWNNCPKQGKAYFSQDLNQQSNQIPADLENCYSYTNSDVRKQCEADLKLASQTDIIQAAYRCYADYTSQSSSFCSPQSECDSQVNECDYQQTKLDTSSNILAFTFNTNSNYKAFLNDLALGLQSVNCSSINTNCANLSNQWQEICIKAQKQQCLNDFLQKDFSSDLSVVAYQCLIRATSISFMMRISFFILLTFLLF